VSRYPVPLNADLGARANVWRRSHNLIDEPFAIATKLGEEFGEVCRALVGEFEQRPGRGDVVQEAAQTIIVLASLIDRVRPGADLFAAVQDEMQRLDA
jgi:hypothetical protein